MRPVSLRGHGWLRLGFLVRSLHEARYTLVALPGILILLGRMRAQAERPMR